ncbi:MAG: rRNA pseudouridine synthase [bacterium]|nr:rRNA pseudouridine synthase [bacterium]
MKIRLNKFLAQTGLGSRRKVEEYITGGRISINNRSTRDLATTVDPENDLIELDGKKIKASGQFYYLLLHKPKGYVTTLKDEKGRPIVMNFIPEKFKRVGVFPVGRLDKDTEGLLLLTNDGDLAHKLTHPKFKVEKEYLVEIDKPLEEQEKSKIERGIFIHQLKIRTRPAKVDFVNSISKKLVKITISEGKKRQIRYTFLNLGYKVQKLKRIAYGPLTLKGINKGSFRQLKQKEINALKDLVKSSK